ncbi:hypothetical protein B0H19DRAFT_1070186 [Mycena capillaripes]|nr:hypothetical protein B0H19DRAFT_1070186 [Mycena capillaripes]
MQFNVVFIATALVVSASPAMSATLDWFSGASCGGSVIAVSNGATSGECIFLANGGSAKSISYSGVTGQIQFFESGGAHDVCSNGATSVLGGGSGCSTAPAGSGFSISGWDEDFRLRPVNPFLNTGAERVFTGHQYRTRPVERDFGSPYGGSRPYTGYGQLRVKDLSNRTCSAGSKYLG